MRISIDIATWLLECEVYQISLDDLALSGTINDETITIIDKDDCKLLLEQLWGDRLFALHFFTFPQNSALYQKAMDIYKLWKSQQLPDLLRAFYALQLEYEPLDNYNGVETTDITFGKTTDTTYGKGETITHGKTNTLETDVYGYNSGTDGADSDKVTSTDGGTTGTSYSGTDGVAEGGTQQQTITKHGNLGITTSQQMIMSEFNMRKKNFVVEALKDFVNTYTTY